jgi:hypothetical protein
MTPQGITWLERVNVSSRCFNSSVDAEVPRSLGENLNRIEPATIRSIGEITCHTLTLFTDEKRGSFTGMRN